MRRLIAFLMALAFVGVSLASPAMATPAEMASHQAHCAERPTMPMDHHKAPSKSMDSQKCCFSALPAVAVSGAAAEVRDNPMPRSVVAKVDDRTLAGLDWTADPPPPRIG